MTDIKDQAGKLVGLLAGYAGMRTVAIGLQAGLVQELARHPEGIASKELAARTKLDPFYTEVWCRSAYASEVLDLDGGAYKLAPHMDTLLLNQDAPAFVGGTFQVIGSPEIFDAFAERLPTGERTWWDQCSPEFIRGVSGTGRAFYTRYIPALERVPGLKDKLAQGAKVLEIASGAGVGLVKFLRAYPKSTLTGLDGDKYSLELAEGNLKDAGLAGKVEQVHSTLEDIAFRDAFDLVHINISMHECRDIEKVAANVHRALRPGGWFVISDFPFPERPEGLRTPPARLMAGIQFFEALIGDQLLPTKAFDDLLRKHGFKDVASFDLTPVHVVIHGRKA